MIITIFSKCAFLLLTGCGIYLTSGKELICWNGHDTAMSVESCPAISSAPTGQTLMGQTAGESSSNETKTFCYYLMYQTVNRTSSTLSFEKNPISARLSHINASCDVQGLCNSSIVQKPVQMTVNNVEVTLFCCDEDKCNKPKNFVMWPVCNNMEGNETVAKGYKETCPRPGDLCLSHTRYQEGRLVSQDLHCSEVCVNGSQEITPIPVCKNISLEKGGVLETCCCRGDLCIPVPANITVIHLKDNNDTYINNTDMTVTWHHRITTNPAPTDWLFVGGLIAAGVLVLVVIGTVVTVWQVKKRREAEARSRMMFSYTPISSSEVENGDLHMLL